MREHAHLPAVVGFMRDHVAKHFRANRPGTSPAVSSKLSDAAGIAKCFGEHLGATGSTPGEPRSSLLRRAPGTVQLGWNLQVRSRQPDPFCADVVHVRKDRCDSASLAGRFRCPGGRIQVFDQQLVHAIVGGKNPDRSAAELTGNLG